VRGVLVTSGPSTPGYDFVSRFFAPAVGVPEDPEVLADYEAAFRDQLRSLIARTRDPGLRRRFADMLDCPIRDSRGHCRGFAEYIAAALIRNGVRRRHDIEAALGYVAERMLMPRGEDGLPRDTVFAGYQERPEDIGGNPLQARFLAWAAAWGGRRTDTARESRKHP